MVGHGRRTIAGWIAALALIPVVAHADTPDSGARNLRIAPPAAWVLAPPPASTAPDAADASIRVVYSDIQSFAGPDGQQTYQAARYRLLKPDALALGNLSFTWAPNGGSFTLHWLRVIHAAWSPT